MGTDHNKRILVLIQDGGGYGDKALALTITCLFICCILTERIVCLQTYDRDALLRIVEHSDNKSIPTFLLSCTEISLCENNETHPTCTTDQRGTRRANSNKNNTRPTSHGRRKRGKRAGVLTRFRTRTQRPPLPAIFLSTVRSLKNKHDELSSLMKSRRDSSQKPGLTP